MRDVSSCSYRSGTRLLKWESATGGFYSGIDYIPGIQSHMYHDFPVNVISDGGELLLAHINTGSNSNKVPINSIDRQKSAQKIFIEGSIGGKTESSPEAPILYDTLISVNVIEHVEDAFRYLNGLYVSLRRGGLLIFHDRYYRDTEIGDGDKYHPIRIKRAVLDRFLMGFEIIFNNCSANYDGRPGEQGYYVIARKL